MTYFSLTMIFLCPFHTDDHDHDFLTVSMIMFKCRMLQRGFPVEPITGPNFCNVNWNA